MGLLGRCFEKLQEKLIAMSGDTGLLGEDVDVEDVEAVDIETPETEN